MVEVGPPYLFGRDENGASFAVTCDQDTGQLQMSVRGRLSLRLSMDTYSALRKCLAEHPLAIIIDLRELDDPYAVSAALWMTTNRLANAMHPPVRVALAVPPDSPLAGRLTRVGAARYFPVFATAAQARTAMASKLPMTDRLHRPHLPPEPSTITVARNLVDDACEAWDMRELQNPSLAIMSELVINAIHHARTEIAVAVWRRGPGLHLSVRDRDPRLPHLITPPPAESGRGLWTVDSKSAAWGAMATHDGKMVWATLRTRRQRLT